VQKRPSSGVLLYVVEMDFYGLKLFWKQADPDFATQVAGQFS